MTTQTQYKVQDDVVVINGYLREHPQKVFRVLYSEMDHSKPVLEQLKPIDEFELKVLLNSNNLKVHFKDAMWFTSVFEEEQIRAKLANNSIKFGYHLARMLEIAFKEGYSMARHTHDDSSADHGWSYIYTSDQEAWVNSEAESIGKDFYED